MVSNIEHLNRIINIEWEKDNTIKEIWLRALRRIRKRKRRREKVKEIFS